MRSPAVTLLLLAAAACSRSATTDATGTPPSTMSATIDGAPWTAANVAASATTDRIQVTGITDLGTPGQRAITMQFARTTTGQQTFPVGATTTIAGVVIGVSPPQLQTWSTGLIGTSGTVTLTTLAADHAVGTFTFTAQATDPAAQPRQRVVTAGAFDVRFTAPTP